MSGKIAVRVPQKLEDWLQSEADKRYLKVGDVARMLLKEAMDSAIEREMAEVKDGQKQR